MVDLCDVFQYIVYGLMVLSFILSCVFGGKTNFALMRLLNFSKSSLQTPIEDSTQVSTQESVQTPEYDLKPSPLQAVIDECAGNYEYGSARASLSSSELKAIYYFLRVLEDYRDGSNADKR